MLAGGLVFAFAPIYTKHDEENKTNDEFINIYNQAQPRQFRVVTATPIVSDLQDGEVVIVSSGTIRLMLRSNIEIYSINLSCVTVRR